MKKLFFVCVCFTSCGNVATFLLLLLCYQLQEVAHEDERSSDPGSHSQFRFSFSLCFGQKLVSFCSETRSGGKQNSQFQFEKWFYDGCDKRGSNKFMSKLSMQFFFPQSCETPGFSHRCLEEESTRFDQRSTCVLPHCETQSHFQCAHSSETIE